MGSLAVSNAAVSGEWSPVSTRTAMLIGMPLIVVSLILRVSTPSMSGMAYMWVRRLCPHGIAARACSVCSLPSSS